MITPAAADARRMHRRARVLVAVLGAQLPHLARRAARRRAHTRRVALRALELADERDAASRSSRCPGSAFCSSNQLRRLAGERRLQHARPGRAAAPCCAGRRRRAPRPRRASPARPGSSAQARGPVGTPSIGTVSFDRQVGDRLARPCPPCVQISTSFGKSRVGDEAARTASSAARRGRTRRSATAVASSKIAGAPTGGPDARRRVDEAPAGW